MQSLAVKSAHETRGVTAGWSEKWDKPGTQKETVAAKSPHFGLQQEGKNRVRRSIDCLHRSSGEIRVREKSTPFFFFFNPQKDNQHEANTEVQVSL